MNKASKQVAGLIGWSALNKISRQIFQFGFLLVLARLLTPNDFGAIAMILVFTGLADLLKSLGFGGAIIHKMKLNEIDLHTAFWSNVLMGVLLFGIILSISSQIAKFYGFSQLKYYMYAVAFVFLINSFNVVQEALFVRNLEFKKLFFIDMLALIPAGFIAIIASLNNLGTWSLIIQQLSFSLISVCSMWLVSSWRPKIQFRWDVFKELWRFGGGLMGFQLVNYASRSADNLIIGKVMGSSPLGIYSRTYQLMLLPINTLNLIVTRVMFPILAKLQGDVNQFRLVYLKSTSLIAMVLFPLTFLLFLFPQEIVFVLYGEKWLGMVPILQIFSFYAIFESINTTLAWIYNGIGKTKILFKWGMFSLFVYVTAILVGLKWGLLGISISYTLAAYIILWIPGWLLAFRQINLTICQMLRNIGLYFILSAVLCLVIKFFIKYFSISLAAWLTLSLFIPLFFVFYFLILYLFKDVNFVFLLNAFRNKVRL